MAVKDGLPATDFSAMNREWVKGVAKAANDAETSAPPDGKPATDFSAMNREWVRAVAEDAAFTPTGKKTINTTAEVDVASYATAQVVDENLTAENIKKDVEILGITGEYEGGGGGYDSELFSVAAKVTFNGSGTGYNETPFSENWDGTIYSIFMGETYTELPADGLMFTDGPEAVFYIYVPKGSTPDYGQITYDTRAWTMTVTSGDAEIISYDSDYNNIKITGDAVISAVKL